MKESKAPTQAQIENGWSENTRDVYETFKKHGLLLLLLTRLDVIPNTYFGILQRDFEQKTWQKIRDGE